MPLSRKKSCIRCRDSKLSCDRAVPACSRCAKRKSLCIYDGREQEHYTPYPAVLVPNVDIPSCWSLVEIEPGSINGNPNLTSDTIDTELATNETEFSHVNWASSEACGDSNQVTVEPFDSSLFSPCNMFSEQLFIEPFPVEAELLLSSSHQKEGNSRMLEEGKFPHVQYLETRKHLTDSLLSVIILGQLTSYPKMLINGYQLPPFIKAPCHLNEELAPECAVTGKHQCLPKVLAVCAGLVQMFYSSTEANAAFVWDMIYAEATRLRREVREISYCQSWTS